MRAVLLTPRAIPRRRMMRVFFMKVVENKVENKMENKVVEKMENKNSRKSSMRLYFFS
jgi:hypothetical protein